MAVDLPTGMITNPNAIPFSGKCPKHVFLDMPETGIRCPVSSRIGTVRVKFRYLFFLLDPPPGADDYGIAPDLTTDNPEYEPPLVDSLNRMVSRQPIYLLQTRPEVPAEIGFVIDFAPGLFAPILVTARVEPVTSGPDGDLRIRTVTSSMARSIRSYFTGLYSPLRVDAIQVILWGRLPKGDEGGSGSCDISWAEEVAAEHRNGAEWDDPNCRHGAAFITNPSRPGPWETHNYVEAWDSNANVDSDPELSGENRFVKIASSTVNSDGPPSGQPSTTAQATYSGSVRGTSPTLDVDVSTPGYAGDGDIGPDLPKKITAVLPDLVNVDVQELGRVCDPAAFDARNCPDSTRVGNVWIKTPLIADGLAGDVHLVRNTSGDGGLPKLGLIVRGAVAFNVVGSNRYTGNGTQIQATFDDIPQIGFESLRLRINGGPNGLLRIDECPTNGTLPNDGGATKFTIEGYGGSVKHVDSAPFVSTSCFSAKVEVKSPKRCVKPGKSFKLSPTFGSRGEVASVRVSSKGSKTKTVKKSPFRVTFKTGKKLKKGKKYKYSLRVSFKPQDGNPVPSVTKRGTFKTCR